MRPSLTRFAYVIAFLLAIGYAVFTLRGGIPALVEKRRQIQELEKRNAGLAREIELKREHLSRLRDSREQQELEIRERLKLAKPGEKVFILQDEENKQGQPER